VEAELDTMSVPVDEGTQLQFVLDPVGEATELILTMILCHIRCVKGLNYNCKLCVSD
jgi:hypothetical protein